MNQGDITAEENRQQLIARLKGNPGATGHQVIARELRRIGITHVYSVPGVPIDETLVACRTEGIDIISTRHQQAAVMAAAAHNWIAGGLKAAVVVSSGPAISNCVTGITIARDNAWPLLIIGGRRDPLVEDRGGFQVLDGTLLMQSVTRTSLCVRTARELAAAISAMADASLRHPHGPCYADVFTGALQGRETVHQSALHEPIGSTRFSTRSALPREWMTALSTALSTSLARSRRPLLLLGNHLRFGAGFRSAAGLIRMAGIPWATSVAMRGLADEQDPLCATTSIHTLLAECDFVLSLGATFDWTLRHGAMLQTSAAIVRIGYDADPVVVERTGSIDIEGDPSAALIDLINELESGHITLAAEPAWRHRPLVLQRAMAQHRHAALMDADTPITPAQAVHLTQKVFAGSRRCILDGNVSFAWAERMFDVQHPLGRLTPGANGCMGTGIPFALGSCMAEPGMPVVVIAGDFALGVSLQDLETLVRLGTAVTVVLLCNGGNSGRLRQQQFWPGEKPDRITRFTEGIRYDRVMIDLGGGGVCVDSVDGLTAALKEAATINSPFLIQVNVRDHVPMPDF